MKSNCRSKRFVFSFFNHVMKSPDNPTSAQRTVCKKRRQGSRTVSRSERRRVLELMQKRKMIFRRAARQQEKENDLPGCTSSCNPRLSVRCYARRIYLDSPDLSCKYVTPDLPQWYRLKCVAMKTPGPQTGDSLRKRTTLLFPSTL